MSWVPFPCSVDLILCWYLWVGNDFNMNWWHRKFFLNHFVCTFRNQTHTYKYKHIVCVYGHPFIYPEVQHEMPLFLGPHMFFVLTQLKNGHKRTHIRSYKKMLKFVTLWRKYRATPESHILRVLKIQHSKTCHVLTRDGPLKTKKDLTSTAYPPTLQTHYVKVWPKIAFWGNDT